MRKNIEKDAEVESNWMTTYSDLVTLLLTFFVLLFAMSTIKQEKFDKIKQSLISSFNKTSNGDKNLVSSGEDIINFTLNNNPVNSSDKSIDNDKYKSSGDIEKEIVEKANEIISQKVEQTRQEMEQKIEELGLQDYVAVVREEHNIVFRIKSPVLFDSGKAVIRTQGKDVLKELSVYLKNIKNDIAIHGHTDNVPISNADFESNWELSTQRANNVIHYLKDECSIRPSRLTATGHGEYEPISTNNTTEGRQKNRRIDIILSQNY